VCDEASLREAARPRFATQPQIVEDAPQPQLPAWWVVMVIAMVMAMMMVSL
jgi:hypothetical protein